MARVSRNYIKSSFFHIMVQGINKQYIYNNDNDKEEYLKIVKEMENKSDVKVISHCVMDNHVHLVAEIKEMKELSKFMHKVNTLYAMYYNKKYDRVGYVYRDRYKSQAIYSEKQLYTCINYVHNNPVKAAICKHPSEYKYSSYNDFEFDFKKVIDAYQKKEDNIKFLEDEEHTEREIRELVEKYLINNNLQLEELKDNSKNIKELIEILKNNYDVSLRKIATYLKISREKVRRVQSK